MVDSHQRLELPERTLLISVDFEDWHQLVRRRVGDPEWRRPGPALARQTEALLALLGRLGACATFFVLGVAASAYPELVRAVVDRGNEIGCHGDQHRPVHSQTPDQFARDLRAACATIEELTGFRPVGYRAPAFSMTARTEWAYQVLEAEGFAYDASRHDSFAIRDRVAPVSPGPHRLAGSEMWEFPAAVWRAGPLRLPVGARRTGP